MAAILFIMFGQVLSSSRTTILFPVFRRAAIQGRALLYGKHTVDEDGKSTRSFAAWDSLPADAPEDLSNVSAETEG